MSKPNKDGWIRHRGGKCPVDDGAIIDVRLANGDIYKGDKAGDWGWNHEDCMREFRLMAWRPHKPDNGVIAFHGEELIPVLDNPGEPNDELKEVLELDAPKIAVGPELLSPSLYIQQVGRVYRHEGDPRTMRDRIREIDATTIALSEERASLVAKLKAEGFALIQGDEANVADEADHGETDIAQQDMSDPANWRVGDLVKSVNDESTDITIGGVYPLWKDPDVDGGDLYLIDSDGDKRNRFIEDYEFHSRPTP